MNLNYLQRELRLLSPPTATERFGHDPSERNVLQQLLSELGVLPPRVDDLTNLLGLKKGRIFAVRWDLTTHGVGFKQPVVTALLLFHLWRRRSPAHEIHTIIDGGNVNTCLALSFVAAQLGLRAQHVLSRLFPKDVHEYLLARGSKGLELIVAPARNVGREREFYSFLFSLMQKLRREKKYLCLWHAKYSGPAVRWMGRSLAESCGVVPDDIVAGLGSGSTIVGYSIPMREPTAWAASVNHD